MELTAEQKKAVSEWVAQGLSLSDIQKQLKERFQLSPTFMEVRLMVLDLDLKVKEQESAFASKTRLDLKAAPPGAAGSDGADAFEPVEDDALGGGVAVEIDRIKKPGALVSGTARFSDGVKASWMVDQFGRVAIDAGKPGYRPSQDDLMAFQQEVSRKLQQQGY
jgi:hypothetical protein